MSSRSTTHASSPVFSPGDPLYPFRPPGAAILALSWFDTCFFFLEIAQRSKKRAHTCACSTVVGSEALCPVKVAMKLHRAATQHSAMGAHPLPGYETFVARSEREVCEQEGGHSDASNVGGVDSNRLPGDGACLQGHWSASHGGGRC